MKRKLLFFLIALLVVGALVFAIHISLQFAKTVGIQDIEQNENYVYIYTSPDHHGYVFCLSYDKDNLLSLTIYKEAEVIKLKRYEQVLYTNSPSDFGSVFLELNPSESDEQPYSFVFFGCDESGRICRADYVTSVGDNKTELTKPVNNNGYYVLVISGFGASSMGAHKLEEIKFTDSEGNVLYNEQIAVSDETELLN